MTHDTEKRSAGALRAHNPFTALICLALAALMALMAGGIYLKGSMYIAGTYGGDDYLNRLYTDVSQMAQYAKPELRGADSLLQNTLDKIRSNEYGELLSRVMAAGAAMYLLDGEGNIVDSFETDPTLYPGAGQIEIVASLYGGPREDIVSDMPGAVIMSYAYERPAFVLDAQGNELGAYRMVGGSVDAAAADLPSYSRYFVSSIDANAYANVCNDMLWGWDTEEHASLDGIKSYSSQAELSRIRSYIERENGYINRAGDKRLMLSNADRDGYRVMLVYRMLNAGLAGTASSDQHKRIQCGYINLGMCICAVALILFIALWVFTDARRRGTHPALWGTLALLGNVVTLTVYLIVRPEVARCPACRAQVKPRYLFCPMCGHRLRQACPQCGEPLRDEWQFCPHCGRTAAQDAAGEDAAG
ncbi:MAG: zinc ribbon domain-containing protein [Candidatus Fimadaptatus sp.]